MRHALFLNAQHHDDVHVFESRLQRAKARCALELVRLGHEGRGSDDAQVRNCEGAKGMVGRACDTRMADVADDGDAQIVEALLALAHGECIEKPLRRVAMCASPADSTLTCGATWLATSPRTPTSASRITSTSVCSASSVYTVSSMLSPLAREESCTSRFTTSAPRRFAASSNDTRVRVDGSVKRLATVTPARTSLAAKRSPGARTKLCARSRRSSSIWRGRPSSVRRCRSVP